MIHPSVVFISLAEESDMDNGYFRSQIRAFVLEKYVYETYNPFDNSYWLPEISSEGLTLMGMGVTWNYGAMKYVKLRDGEGPTEDYKAYSSRSRGRYVLFLVRQPHSNVLASINSRTSVSGIWTSGI